MTRLLLVRLAERRYALPADCVHRIAPAVQAVPLPHVAGAVEGVAAYGRDIVPQIDFARALDPASPPGRGSTAVIMDAAVGPLALRVDAAERTVDISETLVEPFAGPGPVVGRFGRLALDVQLVDPRRIGMPRPVPPGVAATVSTAAASAQTSVVSDPRAKARLLLCRASGRTVAFPIGLVASVESTPEADERPVVSLAPPERGAPAYPFIVTVRLQGGEMACGVDALIGLRVQGAKAEAGEGPELYGTARLLEIAIRSGGLRPIRPERGAPHEGPVATAQFLLEASGCRVLVPRAKLIRVGPSQARCAMPGHGPGHAIVHIEGRILPAIDLGALLGRPSAPRPLAAALDRAGGAWALLCDRVGERSLAVRGRPATRDGLAVLGEAELDGVRLPVLDVDRLDLRQEAA